MNKLVPAELTAAVKRVALTGRARLGASTGALSNTCSLLREDNETGATVDCCLTNSTGMLAGEAGLVRWDTVVVGVVVALVASVLVVVVGVGVLLLDEVISVGEAEWAAVAAAPASPSSSSSDDEGDDDEATEGACC